MAAVFSDDVFKRIFLNENVWVSIKISLKFVPKGSISNIPTLVQIMAWRRPGDKPLSEPIVVNLWRINASLGLNELIKAESCVDIITYPYQNLQAGLTHWGRATHICVGKLTIIGSDNGLSPDRRQTIIWTNAGILLIEPIGTNFSEILIGIQTFSFKKMLSAKWRPFCLGLNVLTNNLCY